MFVKRNTARNVMLRAIFVSLVIRYPPHPNRNITPMLWIVVVAGWIRIIYMVIILGSYGYVGANKNSPGGDGWGELRTKKRRGVFPRAYDFNYSSNY